MKNVKQYFEPNYLARTTGNSCHLYKIYCNFCIAYDTLFNMKLKFIVYQTSNKKEPFTEWIDSLDVKTQTVIATRFKRVIFGNLGDCKPIVGSKGIWELRIDYGPGFRIYFGRDKNTIIVLLIGGDKKSQTRDIERLNDTGLIIRSHQYDQKIS